MKTIYSIVLNNLCKIICIAIISFSFALNEVNAATITSNTVTGNWNATSSWVGGVVPLATDNVIIATGANINANQNYSTAAGSPSLTINGTLTVSGNGTISLLNFTSVSITCPGQIFWSQNANLVFSAGTAIDVNPATGCSSAYGLQPTGGSASAALIVGSITIAVSNDNSNNAAYSFAQFNGAGGLAAFAFLGNSPVCYNSTPSVTLTPTDNIVNFNCTFTISSSPNVGGSVTPTSVTKFTGAQTATITPANSSSIVVYTITCTIARFADAQQDPIAVKTFNITVNPSPTASGALSATPCLGNSATINATATSTTAYQWQLSTDGGSSWSNLSNSSPYSGITTSALGISSTSITMASYNYRVKATNNNQDYTGTFCNATSNAVPLRFTNEWLGTNSANYSIGSNWVGGSIPVFNTGCPTATIPAVSTLPQLSADVTVTNLSIAPSANLDLNGHKLEIDGAFSGSTTGYLKGSAASGITIAGTAGTLYFDQTTSGSTNALKTLNISSGSATLGNALNLAAGTYASPGTLTATGTLNAGGFLILKSNSTGDARVGNSPGTISGNVMVERYIPALRAWRFLTAPFGSGTQTINAAWQEGQQSTSQPNTCPTSDPAPNGYGMYITNTNGSTANGFDWNAYGTQPSFKVWQNGLWVAPSGTNIPITNYAAYCAFVRGDRHVCIQNGIVSATTTTLRSTGVLNQTGGVGVTTRDFATSSTPGQFVLVGNPFASAIDLTNILTRSSATIDSHQFSLWDPKRTGSGTSNVGGYVQYSNASGSGVIVPNGSPSYLTAASALIIQSGQAFFVKENNGSSSAIVKFLETDKTTTEGNVFGKSTGGMSPVIYANLMIPSGDSLVLSDGVAAAFNDDFSGGVDENDVQKLFNFNENIELIRNENKLAIEFRQVPKLNDTLFLKLYLAQRPYTLQLFAQSFNVLPLMKAWLVDQYLNTKTCINLQDTTLYNFTPNSDTNSYRNRFIIVVNQQFIAEPLAVTKVLNQRNPGVSGIAASITIKASGVNIYPNPVSNSKAMLQFNNMNKGIYEITVSNSKGQKLLSNNYQHGGGDNLYTLPLNPAWVTGVYSISIMHKDSKKTNYLKLVISR